MISIGMKRKAQEKKEGIKVNSGTFTHYLIAVIYSGA